MPMFDSLYNTDILTLSASLRNAALEEPDGTARKVSKLCGSWVEIDIAIDEAECVKDCALRVQACALGQASAAILKDNIIGAGIDDIGQAQKALHDMLKGDDQAALEIIRQSRFAKLELLRGVRDYPARHASTLLAFDAALTAMDMALPKMCHE